MKGYPEQLQIPAQIIFSWTSRFVKDRPKQLPGRRQQESGNNGGQWSSSHSSKFVICIVGLLNAERFAVSKCNQLMSMMSQRAAYKWHLCIFVSSLWLLGYIILRGCSCATDIHWADITAIVSEWVNACLVLSKPMFQAIDEGTVMDKNDQTQQSSTSRWLYREDYRKRQSSHFVKTQMNLGKTGVLGK